MIAEADLLEEVIDAHKQPGEGIPVVPEQASGGGHVAFLVQRVAAHEAAEHGFLGGESTAIHGAHVGEGVEEVHAPLAIDFAGAELAIQVDKQLFQVALLPGVLRDLAFNMEAARENPDPLGAGQRADHDGILGSDAGRDAVLGRETGDQRGGLIGAALRVEVIVEGEVLEVGGFAVLLVASQGTVGLARRLEYLPHEETLADL